MKTFKKFIILLAIVLVPYLCFAANTTTEAGRFISITGLDADWYLSLDMPHRQTSGLKVLSVKFFPSAVNDILVIRNSASGTTTAAFACVLKSVDGEPRKDTFQGKPWFPMIDVSYCTFSSASGATVIFEVDWDNK